MRGRATDGLDRDKREGMPERILNRLAALPRWRGDRLSVRVVRFGGRITPIPQPSPENSQDEPHCDSAVETCDNADSRENGDCLPPESMTCGTEEHQLGESENQNPNADANDTQSKK